MIGITISQADVVGQLLSGLAGMLDNPDDLLTVLAREGNNRLRSHFQQRDQTPNALGGTRTHFWQQIADSVSSRRGGPGQLLISITDPRFNQKVFGGDIVPKNAKALTIPVNPAASGQTAGRAMLGPFQDPSEDGSVGFERASGQKLILITWKSPKGNSIGALCTKADPAGKFLEVVFLLVTRVSQAPDPQALPDQAAWSAALLDRARSYVGRKVGGEFEGPSAN